MGSATSLDSRVKGGIQTNFSEIKNNFHSQLHNSRFKPYIARSSALYTCTKSEKVRNTIGREIQINICSASVKTVANKAMLRCCTFNNVVITLLYYGCGRTASIFIAQTEQEI